jgi:hypothetical protein
MKFNWGTGIALLYISFVIGMGTLVLMSTRQKIDLVADNYYDQELQFQGKLDKMNRANALAEPLRWQVTEQGILIQYPATVVQPQGTIGLYCPSDNRKDVAFEVLPNAERQQLIPAAKLQAGRYKIQLDWQDQGQSYWQEGALVLGDN